MRKKTIITAAEWIVAVLLVFLYFRDGDPLDGSTDARKAHELSESSFHYGPSKIVREVSFDSNTVIFLGTYKKWFSAGTSIKRGTRWFPGGGVGGMEIDNSKPLTYSWEVSQIDKELRLAKWYGYVSDPQIKTVVLYMEVKKEFRNPAGKEEVLRQTIKEDRMFLFVWNEGDQQYIWKSIQGLDQEGKLVYEQKLN
ncbi:hypothetical protein KZ483_05660 [Paenibacillus sp. sptzw28]|uniref:hypothetical protein n=1 Tax=Paenibacillus sp. sptzw28 TaxID=715179 RepID=UPI001C6E986F|nr:hypothetical protein [Paenibacillus sp. sptzw28]QYR22462.1 hypothetical protein KZ483_05660 [Paenibacillus sp. sptzw28]